MGLLPVNRDVAIGVLARHTRNTNSTWTVSDTAVQPVLRREVTGALSEHHRRTRGYHHFDGRPTDHVPADDEENM